MKKFTILVFAIFMLFSFSSIFADGGKVYVGFMIHLEDDWNDDTNEASFLNHANQLKLGAKIFNRYGAKFTAECALPFARACENFGDNVLQALLDSTMGISSHSNTTGLYQDTKIAVDRLVGGENNRGISGGFNANEKLDWAQEAARLGFKYIDGPVYFAYLMVPQEMRPYQSSDQLIIDSLYHDPVPPDFEERIHPHRITSAATFPIDTTGPIFFLTGSLGEIGSLAEYRNNCNPNCVFDEADVDTFIAKIRQAIRLSDPDDFTTVYCHSPLKYYKPQNEHLFNKLFNDLSGLVDSGFVKYATQGEIYDNFVEWEQSTVVRDNQDSKKTSFQLLQNYPNPFNPETTIHYQLSQSGKIRIRIYNVSGQLIRTLINTEQPAGFYTTKWDGKDDSGNRLCSGVYYYQLTIDNYQLGINKMILLK